jgi:hypothetical protein
LSVAGLASAQEEPVTIFTPQLISHAAISGAALIIAAKRKLKKTPTFKK